MNVLSLQNSQSTQTQVRRPVDSFSRRRSGEVSFNETEDNAGMQPGTNAGTGITSEFWNVVQNMARKDQISMSSLAVVSQVSQNGVTAENKGFLSGMRNRFSADELKAVRDLVKTHPLLKNRTKDEIDSIMKQLDSLWNQAAPQEAQETVPTIRRDGTPLRSPEQIFFQTTLRPTSRGTNGGVSSLQS
ncbi:MAG: hypothetical protein WA705_20150 [Candidatus Ozemobacteraceae bacterium]